MCRTVLLAEYRVKSFKKLQKNLFSPEEAEVRDEIERLNSKRVLRAAFIAIGLAAVHILYFSLFVTVSLEVIKTWRSGIFLGHGILLCSFLLILLLQLYAGRKKYVHGSSGGCLPFRQ